MNFLIVALAAAVSFVVGVATTRRRTRNGIPHGGASPAHEHEQAGVLLLREALNHLDIGVIVAGPDGKVLYRNDAAAIFSGTHIGVIVEDHLRNVLKLANAGTRSEDIVDLHGPPKVTLALVCEPMPNGSAVATMQDVSERVRIDSMRTDFVTNISHELKTPVGAIAVLAEALEEETDPLVVRRLVDHIVEESHRAVRTIDDLLKLSQIESARPGDEVVVLDDVVHAAISRGRVADEGRSIEVTEVPADPPVGPRSVRVRGDRRQLTSAIGNLVENAVKYSNDGGQVRVSVGINADAVEVVVADRGIGIPARDLDRIFERFYRVDKARSRSTGGSGLGLAIVRHVATNHSGAVVVSSQEGEGSTFVFRLPASLIVPDDVPTPDDVVYSPDPSYESVRPRLVDKESRR